MVKDDFELIGKITNLRWTNEDNSVSIYNFQLKKEHNGIFDLGIIDLKKDFLLYNSYKITGNIFKKSFFWNINYSSYELILEKTDKALIRYLSSHKFKGVSAVTAKKILYCLDEPTLENMEKNKQKISKKIGEKTASDVFNVLKMNKEHAKISLLISKSGASEKLFGLYENHEDGLSLKNILKNPCYILNKWNYNNIKEIDQLARHLGFDDWHPSRVEAHFFAAYFAVANSSGSTVLHGSKLFKAFNKSFNNGLFEEQEVKALFKKYGDQLLMDGKFKPFNNRLIHYEVYAIERDIMSFMQKMASIKIQNKSYNNSYFDPKQNKAIERALNNGASIISGGPGTGKTTILKEIYNQLCKRYSKFKIEILTPTGKAATRINEEDHISAQTIHRFLEMEKFSGKFAKNESSPSPVEVVIIDEFSMVNLELFFSLINACPMLRQIILIGDEDQLASIGYGQLLKDFIDSKSFKTTLLKTNHRQKNLMGLIGDIKAVKYQKIPSFQSKESIFEEMLSFDVAGFIEKNFNTWFKNDDFTNTNILVPVYKKNVGVDEINKQIQQLRFKNQEPFRQTESKKFYLRDKIITIKNDAEKDIFNGDIGYIIKYDDHTKNKKVFVKFGERTIKYSWKDFLEETNLAYAITVHKFQGSESKRIIFILYSFFGKILSKRLIYTGMSRASHELIVIGDKKVFEKAYNSEKKFDRTTFINLDFKKDH